jgi:hypothetical protein
MSVAGKSKRRMDLPEPVLERWATCCAAAFDARDPRTDLARLRITLHVSKEPLPLPGKRLFGAWDPLLRRIELFGCGPERADHEIVQSLGHELWHALAATRRRVLRRNARAAAKEDASEEMSARSFGETWVRCLGPSGVRRCAAALRSQSDTYDNALAVIAQRSDAGGVFP